MSAVSFLCVFCVVSWGSCESVSVQAPILFIIDGQDSVSGFTVYFLRPPLTLKAFGGELPTGGLIDGKSLAGRLH